MESHALLRRQPVQCQAILGQIRPVQSPQCFEQFRTLPLILKTRRQISNAPHAPLTLLANSRGAQSGCLTCKDARPGGSVPHVTQPSTSSSDGSRIWARHIVRIQAVLCLMPRVAPTSATHRCRRDKRQWCWATASGAPRPRREELATNRAILRHHNCSWRSGCGHRALRRHGRRGSVLISQLFDVSRAHEPPIGRLRNGAA